MSQITAPLVSSQGFEYGVKHFYNQKTGLISEILFDSLGLATAEIQLVLKLGAIYINNERQVIDRIVPENQLFRVHSKPRRYNCGYDFKSRVIFENSDFIIVNKASGIPSHPSVDNITENSLSQTALALNCPLYITHRLDTLTSGLIVYAKSSQFVKNFNLQMQNRNIDKKYVALIEKNSQSLPSRVIHYMEPTPRAPKNVSPVFTEGWAFCELEVLEQKKYSPDLSWIKINLLTGRTHQIRSQLSNLGSPILGDLMYGSRTQYPTDAIALRACELEFNWGSQRMKFNLNEEFELV